jgi:hypothetical protein
MYPRGKHGLTAWDVLLVLVRDQQSYNFFQGIMCYKLVAFSPLQLETFFFVVDCSVISVPEKNASVVGLGRCGTTCMGLTVMQCFTGTIS